MSIISKLILAVLIFICVTTVPAQSDPAKAKFANFDGNRIFYTNHGKGKEAIVFVHGWSGHSEFWSGQMSAFPNYHLIALDLIGHGKSDKPKANYTMEYFAKSVDAVMRKAKVKRAVLVGHSMGTPVIRQFYRLYPEKVLGLVIVDGALRPYAPRVQMEQFIAPLRKDFKKSAPAFIEGMLAPIKDQSLKNKIRETMLSAADYVAISAWDGMADDSIWTNDAINVPVLAWMAESPFWAPDTKSFYESIAPKMDFRMMKDVSHFLTLEKPKEFNDALGSFISKNNLLK